MSRWLRGLVEHQQRVGSDEHLCQGQSRALATGKDADALLDVVAVEKKRAQKATLLGTGPAAGNGVHLAAERYSPR